MPAASEHEKADKKSHPVRARTSCYKSGYDSRYYFNVVFDNQTGYDTVEECEKAAKKIADKADEEAPVVWQN